MTLDQFIGWVFVSLPFIGILGFAIYMHGWKLVLLALTVTGLVIGCLGIGLKLALGHY